MDINFAQWADHIVSVVFGGAGGIGAGIAKFRATIRALETKVEASSKELSEKMAAAAKELEVRIAGVAKDLGDRITVIERDIAVQKEREKDRAACIEDLQAELALFRGAYGKSQAEVERSLGAIEGTVNMIAKNGCANRCGSSTSYRHMSSPSIPMKGGGGTKR